MNILSLFDGISCGQIALNRVGVKYDKYFASEIDKNAIKVTQHNYPNTIQIGDVTKISAKDLPKIDLLMGGSPCQGFSSAGKGLNFDDPRSKLFFEFVRLLKECQPRWFLLENVRMKQEWRDIISENLGTQPIEINSSLVSAQNRKRLYWTNIPIDGLPNDKGILIKDILELDGEMVAASRGRYLIDGKRQDGKMKTAGLTSQRIELNLHGKSNTLTTVDKDNLVVVNVPQNQEKYIPLGNAEFIDPYNRKEVVDKSTSLRTNVNNGNMWVRIGDVSPVNSYKSETGMVCVGGLNRDKRRVNKINPNSPGKFSQQARIYSPNGKSPTISANGNCFLDVDVKKCMYRNLTRYEVERLQTVPDDYTSPVLERQAKQLLGNGWTVDVIVHIFKNLPKI